MSRIEQLIAELCPDGVEWKELGEVVEILDYLRKPISNDKRESGIYPYYGANGILGYVKDYIFNGTYLLFGEDGSVIHDDGTPVLTWAKGKIWVNNHAHVLSEIQESALLRYVYYCLSTIDVTSIVRGMPPKINQKSLRTILIPISPLPIQQEIVRILDTFTDLDAELQAELDARKKQYEHYRNQLLNFEGKEVEWKTLGEVCQFVRGPFGGAIKKDCFIASGYAVYEQQHAIYGNTDIRYFISDEKYKELRRFEVMPGDLIMSCSGTMGKIAIIPENAPIGVINQALLKFTVRKLVRNRYFKYYFETKISQQMNNEAKGGAIKNVASVGVLKKINIPIPPLPEQDRIVSILDRFEALVNVELPAEIAARRKQYEYYREKLLTFKRAE